VRSPGQWPPSNPAGSSSRRRGRASSSASSREGLDSIRRLGPGGGASTSQGHPRTVFRRALERGNLLVAEATAREIGQVSFAEALELTLLIAEKEPHRHGSPGHDEVERMLRAMADPPTVQETRRIT
jgi:hypothetical protein